MSGKYWLVAAAAAVWLGQASTASATSFTGSLASPGGIDTQGDWANHVSLSWSVNDTSNAGFWTYDYTVTETASQQSKFVELLLVEVSSDFTLAGDYTGLVGPTPTLGTFNSGSGPKFSGVGGPPSPIFALEWLLPDGGAESLHVQFKSTRVPVWGDFYASDNGARAHNTGFGDPDTDPSAAAASGSIENNILRPDTARINPNPGPNPNPNPDPNPNPNPGPNPGPGPVVPEPTSMLLLGTGLVALVRRHVRK